MNAGEERVMVLSWSTPSQLESTRLSREEALSQQQTTIEFWQAWSRKTAYEGPYREAVERSGGA